MNEIEETKQNEEHLKLLTIFHYVVAGILFLVSCLPLIYVVMGVVFLLAPESMNRGKPPPPPWFGFIFIAFGSIPALLGWALSICTAFSGRFIAGRRRRMFSFVVGALLCIFMPLGTILGVFTILVLNKESVKKLYETPPA